MKFQSDAMICTTNLAASILHENLRLDLLSDTETEPWALNRPANQTTFGNFFNNLPKPGNFLDMSLNVT